MILVETTQLFFNQAATQRGNILSEISVRNFNCHTKIILANIAQIHCPSSIKFIWSDWQCQSLLISLEIAIDSTQHMGSYAVKVQCETCSENCSCLSWNVAEYWSNSFYLSSALFRVQSTSRNENTALVIRT